MTKNGPNSESRNSLGSWAMYANNCYISHPEDDAIVVRGKCIRVDRIPLNDMLHNADSLQPVFDYKPMLCYSTMVQSTVDGQPDELEKLTIFGMQIARSEERRAGIAGGAGAARDGRARGAVLDRKSVV